MLSKLFYLLLLLISPLTATAPRTTLTHFEKDLQKMAKSSKMPVIAAGSFVDRLANKRQQKELIEQELALLQQEVDQLQTEVVLLETAKNEFERATVQAHEKIAQQAIVFQQVTMQLESEQAALRTVQT